MPAGQSPGLKRIEQDWEDHRAKDSELRPFETENLPTVGRGDSQSHDTLFDMFDLSNDRDQSVGDGHSRPFNATEDGRTPTYPSSPRSPGRLRVPQRVDAIQQTTEVTDSPSELYGYHVPQIVTLSSAHTQVDLLRFNGGDRRSVHDTFAPLARRMPPSLLGLLLGFPPIGRRVSRGLCPASFMHRDALRKAAAVEVLPRSGFLYRDYFACDFASEVWGVGVQAPSPTPKVHFQVLPRTDRCNIAAMNKSRQ